MLENACICMKFDLLRPLLVDWFYIVYYIIIIQFSQFYHGYYLLLLSYIIFVHIIS